MSSKIAVLVAGDDVTYPCAIGRSVLWAEIQIRKTFNINGGSVLCDGVGADESDMIEAEKEYQFVGGALQGKQAASVFLSSFFLASMSFPLCYYLMPSYLF